MHNIALSFDVEDWYHTAAISGSSFSKYRDVYDFLNNSDSSQIDCITEETLRIIKILEELDIRATFFVVADVALRYAKIYLRLKNAFL